MPRSRHLRWEPLILSDPKKMCVAPKTAFDKLLFYLQWIIVLYSRLTKSPDVATNIKFL